MTARARRNFDAQDVTIACALAVLAQLAFVALFSLPSPKLIEAEISNDNARPIAVAITPVLKLGSKAPNKIPSPWQRKQPVAAKSEGPVPSPKAEKTPDAIPKTHMLDASAAPIVDAGPAEPTLSTLSTPAVASAVATAASSEGSEQGAANGTETDPLKARAADMYRSQLAAFFVNRFRIRGKLPFDRLKSLHASASVTVTEDRKLGSFSIIKASDDPVFDDVVQKTLSEIQSSGVELPAPPPLYPDLLGKSFPVGFQCNVESACE